MFDYDDDDDDCLTACRSQNTRRFKNIWRRSINVWHNKRFLFGRGRITWSWSWSKWSTGTNYHGWCWKSNNDNTGIFVFFSSRIKNFNYHYYLSQVVDSSSNQEIPSLKEYLLSIVFMPKSLKMICLTNLFCWMSHVCYSLYFTDFVGEAVFNGNPLVNKRLRHLLSLPQLNKFFSFVGSSRFSRI